MKYNRAHYISDAYNSLGRALDYVGSRSYRMKTARAHTSRNRIEHAIIGA